MFKMWAQTGVFEHVIRRELNGVQLADYMAYDQIEPFGEQRADTRSASVCVTMRNMWSGKNSRPAKITDYMLFAKKGKTRKTPDELLIMCRVIHETVKSAEKARKAKQRGN